MLFVKNVFLVLLFFTFYSINISFFCFYNFSGSRIIIDDAPKNISGIWKGILIQNSVPVSICNFKLKIDQTGDQIKGISRIEKQNSEYYGEMEISGSFSKNILVFKELRIISEKVGIGWKWCIKNGKLKLNSKNDSLNGSWKGCLPEGIIKTCREKT